MELNIVDFILLFFLGACLISSCTVGIFLFVRREGNKLSNRLLGAYLILSALTILNDFFGLSGISSQYPFLYFTPLVYTFSFGPLFYLFVKTKVLNQHQLKRVDFLHFILPAIQLLFFLVIGFRSAEYKGMIWRELYGPYLQYVDEGLFPILTLTYIYFAFQIAKKKEGIGWKSRLHKWIKRFALYFGILIGIITAYTIVEWVMWTGYNINIYNIMYVALPLEIATILSAIWITINAWLYSHQALIFGGKAKGQTVKNDLKRRIDELFEEEEVYLNQDLDLNVVASLTGESRNKLSAYFSETGSGFNDFVNQYRVAAFEKLVIQNRDEKLSVEGLAYEVGFNSRSTFYRAFKKVHGISPAEYVKNRKD